MLWRNYKSFVILCVHSRFSKQLQRCMVSLVLGAAHSFSFGACELRWGVGKLHGVTLIYRKATKRQESKGQDRQRYVLGSPAMVLEKKQARQQQLYVQLFLGKIEHLSTLLLAFTQDCPLCPAERLSACVCSSRRLRFVESHGSRSAEPNCQGSG